MERSCHLTPPDPIGREGRDIDVTCFTAIKKAYGRRIKNYIRVGPNYIDKPNFLTVYYETRKEAITTSNI
jgi:hypothetical protein